MLTRPSSAGFTLIEILVVLIVVGLLAALAVISIGDGGRQRELENEVRELYLLMQTASEQAVLNNQELGLLIEEDRYQFVVYDDENGDWERKGDRLFSARQLPEWMTVTEFIENNLPRLSSNEDRLRPDVVFFSSGEFTPFELEFTIGSVSDRRHLIWSDGLSPLEWIAPGEQRDE